MPAMLAALHAKSATAAVGEANGIASSASVVAPLLVGATLSLGLGWRIGYLALPLLALAAAFIPIWRLENPADQRAARQADHDQPKREEAGVKGDVSALDAQLCLQRREHGAQPVEEEGHRAEHAVEQPRHVTPR
jgi:hypothetical protein